LTNVTRSDSCAIMEVASVLRWCRNLYDTVVAAFRPALSAAYDL